ncbi:MAG: hypothetical protein HWE13_03050 [Gammaproteobacteria bacterium]|nr:hypothetical protein [Gammaproteobacteria bacterium]NVK87074.1 hypothetical protein [Gammaproteobacteria bacterium]
MFDWQSLPRDELIEVTFEGITETGWRQLEPWLNGKVLHVECQYGRLPNSEFTMDAFLDEQYSYSLLVAVSAKQKLTLLLNELDCLTCDIEPGELNTPEQCQAFITAVDELAAVINPRRYFIAPEFKPQAMIYLNGHFVAQ